MLNQVVIVGRVDYIINNELKLSCNKPFKNENGEYETDYVYITITNSLANNITEYLKKGNIVGVKGRITSSEEEDYINEIVAEKITFLSSKKNEEKEETNGNN